MAETANLNILEQCGISDVVESEWKSVHMCVSAYAWWHNILLISHIKFSTYTCVSVYSYPQRMLLHRIFSLMRQCTRLQNYWTSFVMDWISLVSWSLFTLFQSCLPAFSPILAWWQTMCLKHYLWMTQYPCSQVMKQSYRYWNDIFMSAVKMVRHRMCTHACITSVVNYAFVYNFMKTFLFANCRAEVLLVPCDRQCSCTQDECAGGVCGCGWTGINFSSHLLQSHSFSKRCFYHWIIREVQGNPTDHYQWPVAFLQYWLIGTDNIGTQLRCSTC